MNRQTDSIQRIGSGNDADGGAIRDRSAGGGPGARDTAKGTAGSRDSRPSILSQADIPARPVVDGVRMTPLMRWVQRGIAQGLIDITLPEGKTVRLHGRDPGPYAEITLNRWRTLRRLFLKGSIGFANAYLDGDWESPDLAAIFCMAARNRRVVENSFGGEPLLRRIAAWRHKLRANTRGGSKRNIAHHYDIGNAFYRTWLDASMTYSSAVYASDSDTLEQAQAEKCRRILRLLDPKPDERVLEIGCGWGALAILAAREFGVRVVGLTISREQFDEATARVAAAGLQDRIEIRLQDYRDFDETVDHVMSVEMIEAVGEAYWPSYFRKIHQALRSGGRAAIQGIVIEDYRFPYYRRDAEFIQTYIFPGGMLLCPSVWREQAAAAGLTWLSADRYGRHYARTLAEWNRRFQAAWPVIRQLDSRGKRMFDERFRRLWTYYLTYCEGGFRADAVDVLQVAVQKA